MLSSDNLREDVPLQGALKAPFSSSRVCRRQCHRQSNKGSSNGQRSRDVEARVGKATLQERWKKLEKRKIANQDEHCWLEQKRVERVMPKGSRRKDERVHLFRGWWANRCGWV